MTNTESSPDQTLLIRALNASKQNYFPTYVGLRLIGSQLPPGENDFLHRLISRRLTAQDTWRYNRFNMYKGSDPLGNLHEYRECLAPSPLTSIAESLILRLIASESVFSAPSRAYSYRWPRSIRTGVSYEYFIDGYKQRNNDIALALRRPNQVAVVTDIKSFYPLASKEQAASELSKLLAQSSDKLKLWRESIESFYSQQLAESPSGIPIGPESSHILGHLVLRTVDAELTKKYGDSYFRYVDDIVVVCDEKNSDQVKKYVSSCLEGNGFSTNESKTFIVNSTEWQSSLLRPDVQHENSFGYFANEIAVYLALHPSRADSLSEIFSANHLNIPVNRLRALAGYSRFRYFLGQRKSRRGIAQALTLLQSNDKDLLAKALRIKASYTDSLLALTEGRIDSTEHLHRWSVQRVRRITNSLFYLREFGEWENQKSVFEAFPELIEQRALANALATGTVNPILPFSGRAARAFSELWSEHGAGTAKLLPLKMVGTVELDALTTLRLSGVLSEREIVAHIPLTSSRLLHAAQEASPATRTSADLTFSDELESLRLGLSGEAISQIVRERYSMSETTVLDALALLSSEYRS